MRIGSVDLLVILVYLAVTVVLGLWAGRQHGTASTTVDYFLGGRQLPWWALLLSIVATETSTATFLSVPGKTFESGGNLTFLQFAAGLIVGRLLVAWLLVPLYFRGELATAYELLGERQGSGTRRLASGLFLATRTVGDALRLYLAALVLHNVVALEMSHCVLAVGVTTIAYTMFGGLRSVVWNDCAQFFVYTAGAVWALTVLLVRVPDGWHGLYEYAQLEDKLRVIAWGWQTNGKDYSLALGLIGGGFLALATHGTDHLIVQRLLGSRSMADARRAMVLSGVVVFLQFSLFLLIGIALAYFYQVHPLPRVEVRSDEVLAMFVVDQLPVGVVGVVLASIFAAAMSTQSSSLNASASAFVGDFYQPLVRPDATQSHLLSVGKWATLLFGILQMLVAIAAADFVHSRHVIDLVLELAAFAYGPILGLFLLAFTRNQTPPHVAFRGFAIGLAVLVTLKLGALWQIGPTIPGLWYTAIGSLVTWGSSLTLRVEP
jgi:SSS family transporter